MTSDDLDSLYKSLVNSGGKPAKVENPGLILSFDTYCHLLGVEPNKDNYNKWKETASIEVFENQQENQ